MLVHVGSSFLLKFLSCLHSIIFGLLGLVFIATVNYFVWLFKYNKSELNPVKVQCHIVQSTGSPIHYSQKPPPMIKLQTRWAIPWSVKAILHRRARNISYVLNYIWLICPKVSSRADKGSLYKRKSLLILWSLTCSSFLYHFSFVFLYLFFCNEFLTAACGLLENKCNRTSLKRLHFYQAACE